VSAAPQIGKLETLIAKDPKFLFTLFSYALILSMYVNLNTLKSPIIGLAATALYLLINGVFLGYAFFEKESLFFRLSLGTLLLILLLGFTGWLAIIIYNLDVTRFTLVLIIATSVSSLLNKRVKHKNA